MYELRKATKGWEIIHVGTGHVFYRTRRQAEAQAELDRLNTPVTTSVKSLDQIVADMKSFNESTRGW